MTHDMAKQFWKVYIGMAGKNGMHANMSNPVDDFKASAHAGEFDKLTDDQYYRKEADAEELSSFWHYKPSETAGRPTASMVIWTSTYTGRKRLSGRPPCLCTTI